MSKTIAVSKRNAILSIIIFILLLPQSLQKNDLVNFVIYQGSIAFSILIITCGFIKGKRYWFESTVIILRLAYSYAQYISTKMAGYTTAVDKHDGYVRMYTLIILTYFIYAYRKQVVWVLSNVLNAFILVNLFSILMSKDYTISGLQIYFLGYRYAFCPIIILAVSLSLLLDFNTYEKVHCRSYFSLIVASLTVIIEGPSTLIVGFITFGVCYCILIIGKKMSLNIYWIIFASIILLDILITVLNSTGIFTWIIIDILHKDLTFTGRTEVWASSIQAFLSSSIWFGNGSALAAGQVGWSWIWGSHYSEHNHYLGVLTNGGIICMALEFLFFFLIIWKLSKRTQSKENIVLAAGFFSILAMGIATQIIPYVYLEILCLIAYHYENCFDSI